MIRPRVLYRSHPIPFVVLSLACASLGCVVAQGGATSSGTGPGTDGEHAVDLASIDQEGHLTIESPPVVATTSGMREGPFTCSDPSGRTLLRATSPSATVVVSKARKVFVASARPILFVSVTDDQNRFCLTSYDGGGTKEVELSPGRYHIYPLGSDGAHVELNVEITDVARAADLARSDLHLPRLEVSYGGPNPQSIPLADRTHGTFLPGWVSASCAPNQALLTPVADLDVKETTSLDLAVEGKTRAPVVALGADGTCVKDRGKLSKGTYRLFIAQNGSVPWTTLDARLEVSSKDFPVSFGKLDTIRVGEHAGDALVAQSSVADRSCSAGAKPLAYLEVPEGVVSNSMERDKSVSVRLIDSDGPVLLSILEPGGACRADPDKRQWVFHTPGRYTVFATSKEKPARVAVGISSRRPDFTKPSSPGNGLWRSSVPVDSDIRSRQLFLHYPFWGVTSAVEALFDDAPAELFVYLKHPKGQIQLNEPLLLTKVAGDDATVLRANGTKETVNADWLVTRRSGPLVLPPFPAIALKSSKDTVAAAEISKQAASIRDFALVNDLIQKERAVRNCAIQYRAKHDPTFGKNYRLVNTRTGVALDDKISKKARKACGEDKVLRLKEKYFAQIAKNRLKEQRELKGHLEAKLH